jgi:hypothetical protein
VEKFFGWRDMICQNGRGFMRITGLIRRVLHRIELLREKDSRSCCYAQQT